MASLQEKKTSPLPGNDEFSQTDFRFGLTFSFMKPLLLLSFCFLLTTHSYGVMFKHDELRFQSTESLQTSRDFEFTHNPRSKPHFLRGIILGVLFSAIGLMLFLLALNYSGGSFYGLVFLVAGVTLLEKTFALRRKYRTNLKNSRK